MVETIRDLAPKRNTNNKEKYTTVSKNLREGESTELVLKYQLKMNEPRKMKDKALIFQDCVPVLVVNSFTVQFTGPQILISMSFKRTPPTCSTTIHTLLHWQNSKTISCTKKKKKEKKNRKILIFIGVY